MTTPKMTLEAFTTFLYPILCSTLKINIHASFLIHFLTYIDFLFIMTCLSLHVSFYQALNSLIQAQALREHQAILASKMCHVN